MWTGLPITQVMAVTSYMTHVCTDFSRYTSVKHMAYICNVVDIFLSRTYMATESEVCIAVDCFWHMSALCSAGWMIKVPSICLSKSLGGWGAELTLFASNSSMNRFAIRGLIGGPMAAPWTFLRYLPWKRKLVFFGQNSSMAMMCWIDMKVMLGSRGCCNHLVLMMEIAGSTGINMKRDLTL